MTSQGHRGTAGAAVIGAGLGSVLLLHVLEPPLAITWSYAHLWRHPALPLAALGLAVVLPAAAHRLVRSRLWRRPCPPWSWPVALALLAVLAIVLPLAATRFPPFQPGLDQHYYLGAANDASRGIKRWYLGGWFAHVIARHFAGAPRGLLQVWMVSDTVLRMNALFGAVALVALAGAARTLAASRGEAVALTVLAWTTFGVIEISAGYLDIYPSALAILALYLWASLRALRGEMHAAWPFAVAALGPFWYEGLASLAPSLALLAWLVARRPGGAVQLAAASAVALVVSGLATLPGYGMPFAWGAFVRDVIAENATEFGYSPTTSLVPWPMLVSATHLREVLHTVLLVDPVGVLLLVVCGAAALRQRRCEPEILFLATLALPYLAYLLLMDAVQGAFADWDLFSFGTATTSLLGGALFVRWGRYGSPAFGALLGLAVATNAVHLLARFHALGIDVERHLAESPIHVPP